MSRFPRVPAPRVYHKFLEDALKRIETNLKDPMYQTIYDGIGIHTLAVVDSIDLGYLIGWDSDWPHRLSRANRAWRLVHGPLSVVSNQAIPFNDYQPVQVDLEFARRDIDPWNLGCSPRPLFEESFSIQWPDPALFIYPENHLVAKEEQAFVEKCISKRIASRIIIVTKSALICSDMMDIAITRLVDKEGEE